MNGKGMEAGEMPYAVQTGSPPRYDDAVRQHTPSAPYSGGIGIEKAAPAPVMPAHSKDNVVASTVVMAPAPPATLVNYQFGKGQSNVICPNCKQNVLTETVSRAKCLAHCSCILLTLFFCWLCCCIPYCMDNCKTVTHKCPNCKKVLGTAV